jgi:hypothetical protein
MSDGPQNLNQHELEELTEFFLYTMPMAQRERLMAEKPVLYHKLFPGVHAEDILRNVRAAITPVSSWQTMEPLADWEKELLKSVGRIQPANAYPTVVYYIRRNQKIAAIKEYRRLTDCGWVESKDAVDAVWDNYMHNCPAKD